MVKSPEEVRNLCLFRIIVLLLSLPYFCHCQFYLWRAQYFLCITIKLSFFVFLDFLTFLFVTDPSSGPLNYLVSLPLSLSLLSSLLPPSHLFSFPSSFSPSLSSFLSLPIRTRVAYYHILTYPLVSLFHVITLAWVH